MDEVKPSSCTIRPARADDYDAIVQVWAACRLEASLAGRESRAAFRRQLEIFRELYLVATVEDRVVGVVLGSHDHRKGWINRLAVLPEHQGRGIAVLLGSACEVALQAEGIEIVAALVDPDNAASDALFRKLGYRADVPVRYYRKLSRPDI
ncbi:MAG: GNAT family N-acetyltransferase [Planctomycetes bacterium]|nr:GNAT family N-acetyltransferase [Planctomycetota bacterium]